MFPGKHFIRYYKISEHHARAILSQRSEIIRMCLNEQSIARVLVILGSDLKVEA